MVLRHLAKAGGTVGGTEALVGRPRGVGPRLGAAAVPTPPLSSPSLLRRARWPARRRVAITGAQAEREGAGACKQSAKSYSRGRPLAPVAAACAARRPAVGKRVGPAALGDAAPPAPAAQLRGGGRAGAPGGAQQPQKMGHGDAPRTLPVTEKEVQDARIPLAWRDFCVHLLIPLNECR